MWRLINRGRPMGRRCLDWGELVRQSVFDEVDESTGLEGSESNGDEFRSGRQWSTEVATQVEGLMGGRDG
jgi:hypothetical protein